MTSKKFYTIGKKYFWRLRGACAPSRPPGSAHAWSRGGPSHTTNNCSHLKTFGKSKGLSHHMWISNRFFDFSPHAEQMTCGQFHYLGPVFFLLHLIIKKLLNFSLFYFFILKKLFK